MADISSEIRAIQLAARGEDVRDALVDALNAVNSGVPDGVDTALAGKVDKSSVGAANGVAELDSSGKVPASQIPSCVDDVLEYAAMASFPATGEDGKIYIDKSTNLQYRWSGSSFAQLSPSLALGETPGTAYRGDRGKTAYDHAQAAGNPHGTTKADIGLSNVDNTSDADKPVSTAQQAALDGKVNVETGKSLMLDTDKAKLDNIPADATNNTGTITKVQANGTDVASSGTANIPAASTSAYGVTKLSSSHTSTAENLAATPKAVKDAYDLASSKTANTGTVTSVAAGAGLTGGTITGSGTIKAKLKTETLHTYASASQSNNSGRQYPVALDKDGYLSVNVPWTTPPSPTTSTPKMDGTAAVGSAASYARADHVHPTDTSRASAADLSALDAEAADLTGFVGYNDADVYGVEVDFTSTTNPFTRLAAAVGKTAGTAFNSVNAFGGRRRCNLTDDGVVTAYRGESGYTETGKTTQAITVSGTTYPVGTAVQVMVEQPKFYYKVVPLELEPIAGGRGYHMRKARYYVSDKPKSGFKLHPAFLCNGVAMEKIYLSAYEGCVYSAARAAYNKTDQQDTNFAADKFSSISGAKPASGLSQALTRANVRQLAHNRGDGWEQPYAATVSASQLLMLVEYASFNMQTAIGAGNVSKSNDGASNQAENTGATSSLGNASGTATVGGIQLVSYRGEENLWGNMWTFIDMNYYACGVNDLYVADHDFADGKITDSYHNAGFTLSKADGWISAFGYSGAEYDWLFVPSEVAGDSALPAGDFLWQNSTSNTIFAVMMGAHWYDGVYAGPFSLHMNDDPANRDRGTGGRLVYRRPKPVSTPVFRVWDNAGAHNCVYRGKFLGTSVTAAQWASIGAGTFEDLYIGDYWTINGTVYRIAAFDYYLTSGDAPCTTHHIVVVPDTSWYVQQMNASNTTAGGYVGSMMYTTGLNQAKSKINTDFGENHILTHRQFLVNAVSNGVPSGVGWYDSTVELMTEMNVYGTKIFSCIGDGTVIPLNPVIDKSQYPLFALNPYMQCNGQYYWLRDVVADSIFAFMSNGGQATFAYASNSLGVRPQVAIKA